MASQHVPKVLPQAVASQEALGMAGSREATSLGNLLFCLAKHKDGIHWKRGPKSKELRCGTSVLPFPLRKVHTAVACSIRVEHSVGP
jgi:hypothetical protein